MLELLINSLASPIVMMLGISGGATSDSPVMYDAAHVVYDDQPITYY